MAITNLKVSNFKSFKDLDLNLGRFNVIIGANASGKSNFVEIFKFLKTLEGEELADAFSLHGGPAAVVNLKLGLECPVGVRVTFEDRGASGEGSDVKICEMVYGFSLQVRSPRNEVTIKDDYFVDRWQAGIGDQHVDVAFEVAMSEGRRKVAINPPGVLKRLEQTGGPSSAQGIRNLTELMEARPTSRLLLHGGFFDFLGLFGFLERSGSLFTSVGVYDIDPHVAKRQQPKAGRLSLEERGENLDLVLRDRLADQEKRRKFHNLLRYVLPFAVEVGVEDLGTSLLLKLREEYYEESLLGNLLSDGTADVVALITALFFEDKDVVIIEEPERNIHPHLISGLVRLMKDAARNKQIIITTHSPEIVRHAGVENLLLVSRDKEGFSTISKPAEKEAVKIFLKNELGLDELFIQNALAV